MSITITSHYRQPRSEDHTTHCLGCGMFSHTPLCSQCNRELYVASAALEESRQASREAAVEELAARYQATGRSSQQLDPLLLAQSDEEAYRWELSQEAALVSIADRLVELVETTSLQANDLARRAATAEHALTATAA